MNAANGLRLIQSVFDTTFGASSASIAKVGVMGPEQANLFIDFVIDQTNLKNKAQVIRMNAPQRRIPLTDLPRKVLWPATSGADLAQEKYAAASVSEVNLETKLCKAVIPILDEDLEDNVEGSNFREHVMRMLATQLGNQLESAFINGVSTNGSPAAADVNQLFNSWPYHTTNNGGHVVVGDTTNALWSDRYVSFSKLSKLIKAMPPKYRQSTYGLNMFLSPNIFQDIYDLYGARLTPGGDRVYVAGGPATQDQGERALMYGNYPMWQVNLLPESKFQAVAGANALATTTNNGSTLMAGSNSTVLTAVTHLVAGDALLIDTGGVAETVIITAVNSSTVTFTVPENTDAAGTSHGLLYNHTDGVAAVRGTADGTFVFFSHASNLVIGIQRDIRVEFERRARLGAWFMVTTLRMDIQMINPDASALLTGLTTR